MQNLTVAKHYCHSLAYPAQTYDGDVRDVYDRAEAATDKWLHTKREEEEKEKEARVPQGKRWCNAFRHMHSIRACLLWTFAIRT